MKPLTPRAFEVLREFTPLLDVRAEAEFAAGHAAGSGHIPLAELEERRSELPARDQAVIVVAADAARAREGAARLTGLGYQDVAWLDAPLAAAEGGAASTAPARPLWRPAPFLERMLPRLPRGRALDVAAGHGRESVFLALAGWDVEAMDRAPEALARAAALAARHGTRIRTTVRDLERRDAGLPQGCFDVVLCFRFLHRPLFPHLERALKPGGVLVYETYRLGQEKFGRPTHRRFLLQTGELAAAFPLLEVEHYAESEPAGGPVTASLLARRPAA